MLLKHVIIYCCVLFDETENSVDEPAQQQQFTLTFTCIKNVVRLVLFVVLF